MFDNLGARPHTITYTNAVTVRGFARHHGLHNVIKIEIVMMVALQ